MVAIKQLTETDYVEGVINQDRSVLARAITLIESTHADNRALADSVLTKLLPHAGGARRVCLLYTSDAADEEDSVDLGGRRII